MNLRNWFKTFAQLTFGILGAGLIQWALYSLLACLMGVKHID